MVTEMRLDMAFYTHKNSKKNNKNQISNLKKNESIHMHSCRRMTVYADGTATIIRFAFSMQRLFVITISCLSLLVTVLAAHAAGTASGTLITSVSTITYSVDDVDQDPITSDVAAFVVDNMVNLTVFETSGTLTTDDVIDGAVGVIATFTVTNNGNAWQDYVLTVLQGVTGQSLFSNTDNFDVINCSSLIESDANVGYQPLQDTATFIDELAPDATQTVYVLCSVPTGQVIGDVSIISLVATTHTGNTAGKGQLTTEDAGADTPGAVQVVFIDVSAGDLQGDNAPRNGQHSARDGYWLDTQAPCQTEPSNPTTGNATIFLAPAGAVDSGNENNMPSILAAISVWVGTDTEAYKDDEGGSESGVAQGWYSTTYNSDLSGAEIVWAGVSGSYISGASYLLVKDGKRKPAWYLFDISNWDGMETISLLGFWPKKGSISHVSILNAEGCDDLPARGLRFDWPTQGNNPATFVEAAANDGSVPFFSTLTLTSATFTGVNGAALTGGVVSNVPPGLTAVLTKTGSTTATLSLIGHATAHGDAQDISNLTVSLNDASFTLGNAAGVAGAFRNDLVVDFIDWAVVDLTPTVIHIQHPSGCSEAHHNNHNNHNNGNHNSSNHNSSNHNSSNHNSSNHNSSNHNSSNHNSSNHNSSNHNSSNHNSSNHNSSNHNSSNHNSSNHNSSKNKNKNKNKNKKNGNGNGNEHGCEIVSGSILTYQIDLPVTGNIDGLVLTNPIPMNMTYVAESIFVNGVVKTDATDGDNAEFSTNTIIVTAGTIAGTTIFSFTFRTTIN
ncbi:MAG: hypothetical protein ACJAWK_000760 [Candidatus Azotimanducaceae bacterium]|jgi:hypothetical protein